MWNINYSVLLSFTLMFSFQKVKDLKQIWQNIKTTKSGDGYMNVCDIILYSVREKNGSYSQLIIFPKWHFHGLGLTKIEMLVLASLMPA